MNAPSRLAGRGDLGVHDRSRHVGRARREADLRWLGLLLSLVSAALMISLVWWLVG